MARFDQDTPLQDSQAFPWLTDQGAIPTHWRNPVATVEMSGDQVIDQDVIEGQDYTTGQRVWRVKTIFADGSSGDKFYDIEGNEMTQSPGFSPAKSDTQIKSETMFDTDLTTGAIVETQQITPITVNPDESLSFGNVQYRTADGTADYTPIGTVARNPIRVRLPTENLAVTGTTGLGLTAIPEHANYVEIYIDADEDDGKSIRWTIDGSEPADNNGEQEHAGNTIRINGKASIELLRMLPGDKAGKIDGSLTVHTTATFTNVSPGADDV